MRLWSLHPKHLDSRGLVALWREGLLALAVVNGKTRGYRHHPQLARFKRSRDPVATLVGYLLVVHAEACARGYGFDRSKLSWSVSGNAPGRRGCARLTVSREQIEHEWRHLLRKLYRRDRARWARQRLQAPAAHPLFKIVPGPIADWERVAVST